MKKVAGVLVVAVLVVAVSLLWHGRRTQYAPPKRDTDVVEVPRADAALQPDSDVPKVALFLIGDAYPHRPHGEWTGSPEVRDDPVSVVKTFMDATGELGGKLSEEDKESLFHFWDVPPHWTPTRDLPHAMFEEHGVTDPVPLFEKDGLGEHDAYWFTIYRPEPYSVTDADIGPETALVKVEFRVSAVLSDYAPGSEHDSASIPEEDRHQTADFRLKRIRGKWCIEYIGYSYPSP